MSRLEAALREIADWNKTHNTSSDWTNVIVRLAQSVLDSNAAFRCAQCGETAEDHIAAICALHSPNKKAEPTFATFSTCDRCHAKVASTCCAGAHQDKPSE